MSFESASMKSPNSRDRTTEDKAESDVAETPAPCEEPTAQDADREAIKARRLQESRFRYKRKSTFEVQREMLENYADLTPYNIARYVLIGGSVPLARDDPRRRTKYRYLAQERAQRRSQP